MKITRSLSYEAIVMGVSAGGLTALTQILPGLTLPFPLPILIVQHMSPASDDFLATHLNRLCRLTVKEAEDKEPIQPETVYIAPANYHLLVEPDKTLSLSTEARVNYSRPAVDLLFNTAAEAYVHRLIGVILTGANFDGTEGMQTIKKLGGLTIAQDPESAQAEAMPLSAITHAPIDHIIPLNEMSAFLNRLVASLQTPMPSHNPPGSEAE